MLKNDDLEFARGLIRKTVAKSLARFKHDPDFMDYEQEILLHVLEDLEGFNPAKGCFKQWTSIVIRRAVGMIQRKLSAKIRGHGRVLLFRDCPDRAPERAVANSLQSESECAIDVAEAIADLPEELRRLAELLKTESLAAAARILNVDPATIRRRTGKILTQFEKLPLREYL